jgi:hypothetical protein
MNNKEQSEKARKRAEKDAQELLDVFQQCVGGETGNKLLGHLKAKFEYGLPIFVKESGRDKHDDPLYDALIRDGNHEVIRYIEEMVKIAYTK